MFKNLFYFWHMLERQPCLSVERLRLDFDGHVDFKALSHLGESRTPPSVA